LAPRRDAPRKYPLRSNGMRGDKQSPLIDVILQSPPEYLVQA
jgi:hypothetical protein